MSPIPCIICGIAIRSTNYNNDGAWLKRYSLLISSPSDCFISAAGSYEGSAEWNVPRNGDNENSIPDVIPVMRQTPEHGTHGFVLHDACTRLLQIKCEFRRIQPRRLIEICKSLPFSLATNSLDWPHGYGGLHTLEEHNAFSWQENFVRAADYVSVLQEVEADPFLVQEVEKIFEKCTESQIKGTFLAKPSQDVFSIFPWEIREKMSILLSTSDALSLRLASASFLPILHSNIFWASRFVNYQERGFLFETNKRNSMNWLSLYRSTCLTACPAGLRNRYRIWRLLDPLMNIMWAKCDLPLTMVNMNDNESLWSRIDCDFNTNNLLESWQSFDNGCCLYRTCNLSLPQNLTEIGISIVNFGITTYITGLRFVSRYRDNIRIGWVLDNEVLTRVHQLCGFRIAASRNGLKAIQIISENDKVSEWIGNPLDTPISNRLVASQTVKAVSMKLDGFKIVGLGIRAREASPTSSSSSSSSLFTSIEAEHLRLRDTALWYPVVPSTELYLNEPSFTGLWPDSAGFQPMITCIFGGNRGNDLGSLVGLSVQSNHCLHAVKFIYDSYAAFSRKLGRCKTRDVKQSSIFEIDGRSGERISAIQVSIQKSNHPKAPGFLKHGALKGLKVITNRDREFYSNSQYCSGLLELPYATGTTITGLYTNQSSEFGLISMGVISELL